GWEDWRPDPAWRVPELPDDWDRRPDGSDRTASAMPS
ncbi:DUF402 domain-containing protein, partial [Streptomyces sp. SID7803]|nr:DUF402 domain-containing protein [Streptomyces sp. SID7803]